jgi:hypothetical protein
MSKHRRKRPRPPALPQPLKSTPKAYAGKLMALVLGAATLIGAYAVLRPNLQLDPSDSLDPKQPFATQFVLANAGYLSDSGISYICGIDHLAVGNLVIDRGSFFSGTTPISLPPGDKATVDCSGVLKSVVMPSAAEISIQVRYKHWIWPFSLRRSFRFVGKLSSSGIMIWTHGGEGRPEAKGNGSVADPSPSKNAV